MSQEILNGSRPSVEKICHLLLQFGTPLVGIALLIYPVVMNDLQFAVVGSFISIPLIAAPLVHRLLPRQSDPQSHSFESELRFGDPVDDSSLAALFRRKILESRFVLVDTFDIVQLGKIYCILYSISIFVAVFAETRPFVYIALVSVMATLLLIQSLSATNHAHRSLVLVESALFIGNLILSMTLKYHYFVGGTDSILHAEWASQIVETHYTTGAMGLYEQFPLWHISVASLYTLFGGMISIQRVMFLASGLVFLSLPVLVYCLFRRISDRDSIALIASVFVTLNPIVIYYGMYATPRSIVSVLLLSFLFICHRMSDWRSTVLAFVLSIALVLFHHVSPLFFLFVFVVYGLLVVLFDQDDFVFNWLFVAIFTAILLAYWTYASPELIATIFEFTYDIISPDGDPSSAGTISQEFSLRSATADLFNNAVYAVMIFFTLFGALELFQTGRSRYYPVVVTAVLLLPLTVPGLSLIVPDLASTMNFDRWGQYTYVFLAFSTAIGVYAVVGRLVSKTVVVVILILLIVPLFSVGNIYVVGDNPVAKSDTHTPYLTTEETTVLTTVDEFTTEYVFVDYVSHRYLTGTDTGSSAHILEVDESGSLLTQDDPQEEGAQNIYLFRNDELEDNGLKVYLSPSDKFELVPSYRGSLVTFDDSSQTTTFTETNNKVYDSDSIVGIHCDC